MAMTIDIEKLVQQAAERAMDELEFSGHTLREWVRILAKVDKAFTPRGYWIEDSDPGETYKAHWKCSNCKHGLGITEDWIRMFKFCPLCGAKMDLEGLDAEKET